MTTHIDSAMATIAEIDETADCLRMVADTAWATKDWTAARRAYALVLARNANDPHSLNRMGRLHLIRKEYDAAIESFSGAFLLAQEPSTCINLAIAYQKAGDSTMALYWCAEALLLKPGYLQAFIQQSAIYEWMGQITDAQEIIERGLELHPQNPELLYAQGIYRLMRGDYQRGLLGYEYRSNRRDLAAKLDEYPEWQGESLDGKTILVAWEQGYGDQVMWARYVPVLEEAGAQIVLFTRPDLARLFAQSFPDTAVQIVTTDAELAKLEPDYWVAMGSLPLRCAGSATCSTQPRSWSRGTVPPGFNSRGAYLYATAPGIERFRALVPADGTLRVGLCWAGNPGHIKDARRSMTWEQMRPLLDVPGCKFYSLQRGGQHCGLPSLVDYCHDLADTAAAISCLDLVISVDTVILHLAGALGKPVWGIVPTEWRWGPESKSPITRTPWYDSASLFARSRGVTTEMVDALTRLADRGDLATDKVVDDSSLGVLGISSVVTRDCRYGRMSWYANDTYIGRALDLYGEYSESEAELLRRVLKPRDVVIEAGANIGGLTVAMAAAIGPTGIVLAFEPQPRYHALLQQNAPSTVLPLGLALGAEQREITLRHVPTDRLHAPGWASTGDEFYMDQVTIDSFELAHVDLIKIDVDGQELDILRGAEKTIAQHRPIIYVENDKPADYPDLMPWLIAHGYRLYQHLAPLFSPFNFAGSSVNVFGSMVSAMLLCVPQERKDVHPGEWGLQRIRAEK